MKFNNENLNKLDIISNLLIGYLTEVTTTPSITYMNNNGNIMLVPGNIMLVKDDTDQYINIIDLNDQKRKVSYHTFNTMVSDMINCWYNNIPNKTYQKYRQHMVEHLNNLYNLTSSFYN